MMLTAVFMGLAGSLHCLGMCSPLAMAATSLQGPFLRNRLVYNGGRIFCYGLLGCLAAAFGSLFSFSTFQNMLTVSVGGLLILIGLAGTSRFKIPVLTGMIQSITIRIKTLFSVFLQKKTFLSMVAMGMLNGLLPCGLTYLALTSCLALPSIYNGFFFMVIFGAGTLPMMLGFTSGLQSLLRKLDISIRSFTTVAMIAIGTLLVSRGVYVRYHMHTPNSSDPVICK